MALSPGEEGPPSYGAMGGNVAETEVQTLFTGAPSRPVFPRGFLWDEGFHQVLAAAIDPALAAEVLEAWMGTMLPDGWIPRE